MAYPSACSIASYRRLAINRDCTQNPQSCIRALPRLVLSSAKWKLQGQVRAAVPETAVDIAPPGAELEEAIAVIVTVPAVPGRHWARPLGLMVAILGLDDSQLPE